MASDIIFHILDIQSRDQCVETETEDTVEISYDNPNQYNDDNDVYINNTYAEKSSEFVIHVFGSTDTGKPVRADITGFHPTFYIQLPEINTDKSVECIKRYIASQKISEKQYISERVSKMQFYGFTAQRLFQFLKIEVLSLNMFYRVKNLFLNKSNHPETRISLDKIFNNTPPTIYEANIDPMLRFLHHQNLNPCGWAKIVDGKSRIEDIDAPEWVVNCNYAEMVPTTSPIPFAPFLTAAWDIECYSSTGDFPLAKGSWTRLGKSLLMQKEIKDISEAMPFLIAQFHNKDIYHIQSQKRLNTITDHTTSASFAELVLFYQNLSKQQSLTDSVETVTKILETIFKNTIYLVGDPVIQIGVTLIRNSEYQRHLFVFPDCGTIDGICVHAFADERTMLEEWFRWIYQQNPDILIGYNVFGFDEKYVWERADYLGIITDDSVIHNLSRLCSLRTRVKCEDKFLSSSALGDNFMNVISMHGRLQVDMYHYIRRMMVLPSYKLDSVVKHFMSGKLVSSVQIDTNGTNGTCNTATFTISGAIKDVCPGRAICLLDDAGDTVSEKLVVKTIIDKIVTATFSDSDTNYNMEDATKWVIVKDDISPQDIFRLHRGSAEDRAIVGKYCIQDCDLVYELYKKLEVFANAMSMANVCSVPISFIFMRGQGIKIESLIFKACRDRNILIQVMPSPRQKGEGTDDHEQEDSSYEGAIVLDPIPGFYSKSPVGVADFASLYPSSIVSENISHDSLVWTKDYNDDNVLISKAWGSNDYDNHPGFGYTDIEFDLLRPDPADKRKNPVKIKAGRRICRYAQPLDGTKSTLPSIICHLLEQRKATRKLISQEKNPEKVALLDALQLAYKLTANSLYGQLGSETFKIRLQHLAASVTAYGRKQIMFAKEVIERFYGSSPKCRAKCSANIVYGDSVTHDTPVILNQTVPGLLSGQYENMVVVKTIGDLFSICKDKSTSYVVNETGKEYVDIYPFRVHVWTENGFTLVKRIMRHRLDPAKKLYRITTPSGIVDATSDHSLVNSVGDPIKTIDVIEGRTELLHKDIVFDEPVNRISENYAYICGYLMAYGRCTKSKSDMSCKTCTRYSDIFEDKFNKLNLLNIAGGNITLIDEIINASIPTIWSFWVGLCRGNHDESNLEYVQIEEPSKYKGTYIYIVAKKLGYDVEIDVVPDRDSRRETFIYTAMKIHVNKCPLISPTRIIVNKIIPINVDNDKQRVSAPQFVYDLETANHHFGVGPGSLIVHNTDSLFVEFGPLNPETGELLSGRDARQATMDLTEEAGKLVTKVLRTPHDFEFDKVFDPLLMFSKKRYAGNMYEEDPDHYVLKYMGIALKRRDSAPIVKTIFGGALKRLLNEKDVIGATEFVQESCMDLVNGKTSLYQLTISKSLRAEYANPGSIAHRVLADRITKRDPGNAPSAGDRIEYIYVCPPPGQPASKLQGDRIETPAFVTTKGLIPDYSFYIEHQLSNPVSQMFGLLVEQLPGFNSTLLAKMPSAQVEKLAWAENIAADILFSKCLKKSNNLTSSYVLTQMFRNVQATATATNIIVMPKQTPDKQLPSIISVPDIIKKYQICEYDSYIKDRLTVATINKVKSKAKKQTKLNLTTNSINKKS